MLLSEAQIEELGFDVKSQKFFEDYPGEIKYSHKTKNSICLLVCHGKFPNHWRVAIPQSYKPAEDPNLSYVFIGRDIEVRTAGPVFYSKYMEDFPALKQICKKELE